MIQSTPVVRTWPIPAVRWGAVLAGMAVGIALHLVLMVAGTALGLAVLDPAERRPGATTLPVAAAAWNALSMLVSAFIGGYVAARASGLRRTGDGVLHGAVSWGATTLAFALLTMTALGAIVGGLFGTVADLARPAVSASRAGPTLSPATIAALRAGDRATALRELQAARPDLSEEAANRTLDLAAPLVGAPTGKTPQAGERAADVAAAASGWLAGAIVLSLLAGLGGGALGARGARRFMHGSLKAPPLGAEGRPAAAAP